MAEVKISMMSLATVLYAALVNGDLCGGLWIIKDAKMDANLACKGMTTHHIRFTVQTNQNNIDPATYSNRQ
jgi:hypothetical protein